MSSFYCSRISHNTRVEPNGSVLPCCIMENTPQFFSIKDLHESSWYKDLINANTWPKECFNCKLLEEKNILSPRNFANKKHKVFLKINPNYKTLDLAVSNVCNAACQTCSKGCSSFYAKIMKQSNFIRNKGLDTIKEIDWNNVIGVDFNGGDPLYSNFFQKTVKNLPNHVKWIKINTNASVFYDFTAELENKKQIEL